MNSCGESSCGEGKESSLVNTIDIALNLWMGYQFEMFFRFAAKIPTDLYLIFFGYRFEDSRQLFRKKRAASAKHGDGEKKKEELSKHGKIIDDFPRGSIDGISNKADIIIRDKVACLPSLRRNPSF